MLFIQNFLAATTQATFVIFIDPIPSSQQHHVDEFNYENATTKEQLTVRNAIFEKPGGNVIHYVEILRHQMGANATMREWIKNRAHYEKLYKVDGDEAEQIVRIRGWPPPTIG